VNIISQYKSKYKISSLLNNAKSYAVYLQNRAAEVRRRFELYLLLTNEKRRPESRRKS